MCMECTVHISGKLHTDVYGHKFMCTKSGHSLELVYITEILKYVSVQLYGALGYFCATVNYVGNKFNH